MNCRNILPCLLLLAFCVAVSPAQNTDFSQRDVRYRLQTSDVMEIHYRYSPEFDQTVTVQPDGFVTLQLIGDLKVAGLTLDEAKAAVLRKASERLKDPEINLVLKEFEKPYFVVGGEVATPGRFDLRGQVSVAQAIAMAGGMKTVSAKHSQVILFRRAGGEMMRTEILDLKAAMSTHANEPLPDLRSGDMLFVPQNRISKIERLIKIGNIGAYFPL